VKSYRELNAMPAESFLTPDLFVTENDGCPRPQRGRASFAAEQYAVGLDAAQTFEEVGISANGTWYASSSSGEGSNRSLTSYEGIGYHADTASLLAGLLAGRARFVVYRATPEGVTRTVLREARA
jgi:hypothetical protein